MNPNAQFERDLEQWLQTEAPASAPAGFHATVMDRARTLRQRPGWTTTLPGPTVRPGPRHHPSRGRSPAARRRGVGGGLRHPAAADRRPAGACTIGRCGRHGIARRDVPEPERVGVAHPGPQRDPCADHLDRGRSEGGLAVARPHRAAGDRRSLCRRPEDRARGCPGSECGVSTDWERILCVDPTGDTGSADTAGLDIEEVTFCGSTGLAIGRLSGSACRGGPQAAVDRLRRGRGPRWRRRAGLAIGPVPQNARS